MVAVEPQIYLPAMYVAEHLLATKLATLLCAGCDKIEPVSDGLKAKQPQAVVNACGKSLSILTGGPGTGKTTTTRKIVHSFNRAGMHGIAICPTGRAAKRADEVINENTHGFEPLTCTTIHVGLGWSPQVKGGFTYNRNNPVPYDYVLIDEFPMCDLALACSLFNAIDPRRTRVILVGDQYQLPSVGPGNFGRDVIESKVIPFVELDEIFRTGAESGIAINANRILNGKSLLEHDPRTGEKFTDFFFVPSKNEAETLELIMSWAHEKIPKKRNLDPLTEIQVLCPGKKSIVGAISINDKLRNRINPTGEMIGRFRVGDRVINNRNIHQISLANGDIGFLRSIRRTNEGTFPVFDFGGKSGPNGNGIVDDMRGPMLDYIDLAFATTIHKSQGSEYRCVLIPIHKCHYKLLFRNLIYTGITRARELCAVAGDPAAVNIAIANNQVSQRNTRLMSILQEAVKLTS